MYFRQAFANPRESVLRYDAPAARVVDPECDLRPVGGRVTGVDRPLREDRPALALRAVPDERLPAGVDPQRDVLRVPRDQLGRLCARRHHQRGEQADGEDETPHRRRDRQHRGKHRALSRGIRREPIACEPAGGVGEFADAGRPEGCETRSRSTRGDVAHRSGAGGRRIPVIRWSVGVGRRSRASRARSFSWRSQCSSTSGSGTSPSAARRRRSRTPTG